MIRKILLGFVGLVVVIVIIALDLVSPERPPDQQAFVGGRVLTMNARDEIAEAVLIEGERISVVGTRREVEAAMPAGTIVHDLTGRTLIPGFIDAHGHFPGSGLSLLGVDLNSPPIGTIESLAALEAALVQRAEATPPGEWIFGFGYDDTLLREKRHPTRADLDRVSTKHPIYLSHVSGHLGVANSMGLERAGIDAETADPEGGVIVRDPSTGEPTGLLEENAGMLLYGLALAPTPWDFLRMIRFAADEYAAQGVTMAQSGGAFSQMARGLYLASLFQVVPFRLEVWPIFDEMGLGLLDGSLDPSDYETDKMRLGAVKIIADGSIQGYTGYLSEPYHVPFHDDATYRGYPRIPRDELADWIRRYHAAGIPLAIHGNGDASIDDIIHGFRQAQASHPHEDPRLIVVHAQMARDDQLDDMKALGMTPSFFSAHTYYWGDRHWSIFMGPERAARMSPTRSALDRGLRFSVHLDTPVTPMKPLIAVWSTVNRISTGGRIIGAAERITPMQALRAVTIDAAWQIFREHELGSIEPGKLADLVVLDGDPLANPMAIRDLGVDRTLVGGVTIFAREQ